MLDVVQIDPAKLLSSMWLDVTGRGERVSRDVLSAGAVPRLLPAAQRRRFEFEFDREHGTPLYAATFEAEELTRVAAVRAIEYGPVDPSVFQFTVTRDAGEPLPAPAFSGRRPPLKRTSRDTSVSPPPIVAAHPTIWLTGIPSAGKTTIARATERLLHQLGVHCCILDGDELRDGLSCDLGLTRPDRREQARRAAHIAALVAQSGVVPIVALVSPYAEDRAFARDIHEAHAVGFLEVWVDTPLEICAGRDPKGLYAATYAAAASDRHEDVDGSGLTGVSAPYEPPRHPDLTVRGDTGSARNAASQIVEALISRRPGTYVFTTR
jgi:adenylyl-sulfate kinase